MQVENISAKNIRCIEDVEINLYGGINVFFGDNGSGKTTIIESINVLASGRSFRTSKLDNMRRVGEDYLSIASRIKSSDTVHQLGLRKSTHALELRVNSMPTTRLSDLAHHLAVIVVHAETDQLVQGEPLFRRRYIDWWLFYSNSDFHSEWSRYQRLVKQRNAALRSDVSQLDAWDELLAESGEKISHWRSEAAQVLMSEVFCLFSNSFEYPSFSWSYQPGWSRGDSLNAALQRSRSRDIQQGFTSCGPHRADLRLQIFGRDAKDCLSRGQQKSLSILMLLALARRFHAHNGESPVFMLDDLAAELDYAHRSELLHHVSSLGGQVLLTALMQEEWKGLLPADARRFVLRNGRVDML